MLQYRLGQAEDYSLDRTQNARVQTGTVKYYSLDRMQNATVQIGTGERLQFRQNAECYSTEWDRRKITV